MVGGDSAGGLDAVASDVVVGDTLVGAEVEVGDAVVGASLVGAREGDLEVGEAVAGAVVVGVAVVAQEVGGMVDVLVVGEITVGEPVGESVGASVVRLSVGHAVLILQLRQVYSRHVKAGKSVQTAPNFSWYRGTPSPLCCILLGISSLA